MRGFIPIHVRADLVVHVDPLELGYPEGTTVSEMVPDVMRHVEPRRLLEAVEPEAKVLPTAVSFPVRTPTGTRVHLGSRSQSRHHCGDPRCPHAENDVWMRCHMASRSSLLIELPAETEVDCAACLRIAERYG